MYMQGLQVYMCKIIHFPHFGLHILFQEKQPWKVGIHVFSLFDLKTLHHLEFHCLNQMGKDIGFTFVTLDIRV
jgi:hypothetical protein